MPTRAGWGLVAAGAITLIAARVFALTELYLLGITALALLAASLILVTVRRPSVAVDRFVSPHRVQRGGQCRIELRVTNPGVRPTPVVTLHEPIAGMVGAQVSVPPLRPEEVQSATYRLPAHRRGLMPVGPLSMTRTDPFGLVAHTTEIVGQVTVTVIPAIDVLGPVGIGGGVDDPLAGLTHTVMGLSGEEDFSSLRDYVVGDDLRRVHWASSARRGDLLVREDDPPWRGHVTVVLDSRADRMDIDRFEDAVSAAASVLQGVAQHGDRARLMITDGTDTGLVDAAAERDLLLEHLALVTQQESGSYGNLRPPRGGNPGGLVVMTGDGGAAGPRIEDQRMLATTTQDYSVTRVVRFSSAGGASGLAHPQFTDTGAGAGSVRILDVPVGTSFATVWRASFSARRGSGVLR